MNSYFVHVYNRMTSRKHYVKVEAATKIAACRAVLASLAAPECIAYVEAGIRRVA